MVGDKRPRVSPEKLQRLRDLMPEKSRLSDGVLIEDLIDQLPSLRLSGRESLPSTAGIYFAYTKLGVEYVGRSVNINQRWKNHHRTPELEQIEGIQIAYLEVEPPDLLPEIESLLIELLDPPMNGSSIPAIAGRKTATVRPYLRQSLLTAAREAFPSLDKVTDREFIEFCLIQAMNSRIQPVVSSTYFSATSQPITQDNQDDEPNNDVKPTDSQQWEPDEY
jgi:hypothetical protein